MTNSNDRPGDLRWCSWCERDLPRDTEHFYRVKTGVNAGRFSAICIECYSKHAKTPEYRRRNRIRCKGKESLWRRDRNRRLDTKLRSDYGIDLNTYNRLLLEQGGKCRICRGLNPSAKRLGVDHDHETGVVRGLLCFMCNMAIGYLKHDPEILTNAIDYLKNHANIKPFAKELA